MADEPLDIVPMPPLVDVLMIKEKEKMEGVGVPLTEAEVLEIRDNAISIALPRSVHVELVNKRGYRDIDPNSVWSEWQLLRNEREADD